MSPMIFPQTKSATNPVWADYQLSPEIIDMAPRERKPIYGDTPSRLSRLQDAYEYKIKHGWTPLTPEEEVEFHKMIAEFTNL